MDYLIITAVIPVNATAETAVVIRAAIERHCHVSNSFIKVNANSLQYLFLILIQMMYHRMPVKLFIAHHLNNLLIITTIIWKLL